MFLKFLYNESQWGPEESRVSLYRQGSFCFFHTDLEPHEYINYDSVNVCDFLFIFDFQLY